MRDYRLVVMTVCCALVVGSLSAPARADSKKSAFEGCLQQSVFNGTWRVRVTKIEPVHRKSTLSDVPATGWGVWMEWTNASGKKAQTYKADDGKGTFTETGAVSWRLTFTSGAELGLHDHDASTELSKAGTGVLARGEDQTGQSEFFDQDFPPGVTRKGVVKFWYPQTDSRYSGQPTKLIVDGEPYVTPHFAAMTFKLTCAKTAP